MAVKWIGTKFKGVRYYEHPTRKHGVKKDHYLSIRYQMNGKRIEEGIGWTSERDPEDNQYWTEAKAALVLESLKSSAKHGKEAAPTRIAEKRELARKQKELEIAEQERQKKESITLNEYFYKSYYPDSKINKKKASHLHEETHFRLWIDPIAGKNPLKDLSEFDVRRIVKKLLDAGKRPRTIQYVMATLRQVWNKARRGKIVSSDSPTKDVKIPKFDNKRQRFLSHEEADLLLETLKNENESLHKMSLLSLHSGMRASEIFKLTWGCVDTERGIIVILDAKSGHGRAAFMTEQIKKMFNQMERGKNDDFVFLRKDEEPFKEIPVLFRDVIKNLKFNENVSDLRQRVCFHTLRHTMASWHAESGTDLYILKELLGHGSITLTERYSHLTNGALQDATRNFEKKIVKSPNKNRKLINFEK